MRILLVCEQIYSGAAGAQVARSAAQVLREAGHEVAFLAQDQLPDGKKHLGAVYLLPRPKYPAYVWGGGQLEETRRAVHEFKPEVAHVIQFGTVNGISWAAIKALQGEGIPVVYAPVNYLTFCMNTYFYRPGVGDCQLCLNHQYRHGVIHQCGGKRGSYTQWVAMQLQKETVKNFRAVLSTCEDVDQAFVDYGIPREKLVRTYHAFEWERVQGQPISDSGTVLFYGQGREEKGIHLFPQIFSRVKGINFELYLWSGLWDGVYQLRSDQNTVQVNTEKTWKTGLHAAVASARAAVLPTVNRSFGELVVYEAMALGKPVIAFALGANPTLIRNGVDGILVPPGDLDALAAAVQRVHDDAAFATAVGRSAAERARHLWSNESVYATYQAAYDVALKNP